MQGSPKYAPGLVAGKVWLSRVQWNGNAGGYAAPHFCARKGRVPQYFTKIRAKKEVSQFRLHTYWNKNVYDTPKCQLIIICPTVLTRKCSGDSGGPLAVPEVAICVITCFLRPHVTELPPTSSVDNTILTTQERVRCEQ